MGNRYINAEMIDRARVEVLDYFMHSIVDDNGKMLFDRPLTTEITEKVWDVLEKLFVEMAGDGITVKGPSNRTVDMSPPKEIN